MGLEKLPHQGAPRQSSPEREANRKMAEQPEKWRDFVNWTVRMQSHWKPVNSWRCRGHHQNTSALLPSKHTHTLGFCHMTMRHLTPLSPHRGDLHADGNIWSQHGHEYWWILATTILMTIVSRFSYRISESWIKKRLGKINYYDVDFLCRHCQRT